MLSIFYPIYFQKRSTASGDNGCKLTQFTRNISKFDCYFGHKASSYGEVDQSINVFDHD